MDNPNWRAQLREAGIDRRAPPSSKGALQDKVAAVPVTVLRLSRPNKPNNVITIAELAKWSEPSSPSPIPTTVPATAPVEVSASSSSPSAPAAANAPSPSPMSPRQPLLPLVEMPPASYQPPPSMEEPRMPTKVSNRNKYAAELRERIVRQIIDGPPGTAARLSREHGLSEGLVSQWVTRYRKKHPERRTLVSNGHSPKSGAVAIERPTAELPPLPEIRLDGLAPYVRALVRQEVDAALREWKRRMFEGS